MAALETFIRVTRPYLLHACLLEILFSTLVVLYVQSQPAHSDDDWARHALERSLHPPIGLPELKVPKSDPLTAAKIGLGAKLFFDDRLSRDNSMSCASCHVPEQGFTSNDTPTATGVGGRALRRNAPSLFNVGYMKRLFHDGREGDLSAQVWGPLLSPLEMANASPSEIIARINSLRDYRGLFQTAYGRPADARNLGQALAAYQRSLLSANAPFDRWRLFGEADAMPLSARRGFSLFTGKGGCARCHTVEDGYALFTDHQYYNTGIGAQSAAGGGAMGDLGRMAVSRDLADIYRFKTPGLRNVALTAPYMHDGSIATLKDAVRFYNRGGAANPGLHASIKPLGLNDREIDDLVAFLQALTGSNVDALISEARNAFDR